MQATIDEAKEMLRTAHQGIAPDVEPFELAEPSAEDMELVRQLIAQAAE